MKEYDEDDENDEIKEIKEIKEVKEINKINGDKTFNKLRNIQILIRKESSLKGLCKYIYNNSKVNKNSHKNNKRNNWTNK